MRSALILLLALFAPAGASATSAVPLTALGHFQGWRGNALIGYGLVTGLAGSGDTRQSAVTRQALRNVLSRLGTAVSDDQLSSRNVAAVVVTAVLPPAAHVGDRLTVTVSSIGDARSLAGGTLLMTTLMGPDARVYALAQGALATGGYSFESDLNRQQRNYPTTAILEGGATVESAVESQLLQADGTVGFMLSDPSFAQAERIAQAIDARLGPGLATVRNADEVRVRFGGPADGFGRFMAALENLVVEPGGLPRVVINERTGTIVAGGDVRLSSVVIAQGDLRITVTGERSAAPASLFGGDGGATVVTNTRLKVEQGARDAVATFPNTSVADLVEGLARAHVDTRRTISVLQAIKAAGALHADLVIQ